MTGTDSQENRFPVRPAVDFAFGYRLNYSCLIK